MPTTPTEPGFIPAWLNTTPERIRRRLSVKEGWFQFVLDEPQRPARYTIQRYSSLTDSQRRQYDDSREQFHRSLVLLRHTQLQWAWEQMDGILAGSAADRGPGVGIALTGGAGFGKTTIMAGFAREWERDLRADYPAAFEQENLPIPVCYSSLLPRQGLKSNLLNILSFYGEPASRAETRGATGAQLLSRLVNLMRDCQTHLLVLDQAQNLHAGDVRDREVAANLKHLLDDAGAVMALVGIDLHESGPLAPADGHADRDQLAQRFRLIEIRNLASDEDEWRSLLHGAEDQLVLLKSQEGDLSNRLAAQIWELSEGRIGVAMNIVHVAANMAIRTESERITRDLLRDSARTVAAHATAASEYGSDMWNA